MTAPLKLNDGRELPVIGFGTFRLGEDGTDVVTTIRQAIDAGYRHFDCAWVYGNEEQVGQGLNDALSAGDVTREELFITSKVWPTHMGREKTQESFQESLEELGLDFLDMLLIHWPWPQSGLAQETFEAMADIQGLGHIMCLGVSNFEEPELVELIEATGLVPVVNQVEAHIGYARPDLQKVHARYGIVSEAYSTLRRGDQDTDMQVHEIAKKYGMTPAQVALRFLIQQGYSVIPKTTSPERMKENLATLDFHLLREDMELLAAKDEGAAGRKAKSPYEFPG